MSGGSVEREGVDDQQCVHCGRWYQHAGVISHERHCTLAEVDARMVELVDPKAKLRLRERERDIEDIVEESNRRENRSTL